MYSYLEKFLGETTRSAWEAYKQNFPLDFVRDIELGANPYNFTNKIQIFLLGTQPNTGQENINKKLLENYNRFKKKNGPL